MSLNLHAKSIVKMTKIACKTFSNHLFLYIISVLCKKIIFSDRNWALHTKKWSEGERTDISTWKTRFRCALTKLQDIAELSHMHQTEGDDPFRVYQFKRKGN